MARYSITLTTYANTSVEVEVPDGVTDPEEIAELALRQNEPPTLCHQCTGGGYHGQYLEIGDEWQPGRLDGVPTVTRLD